MQKFKANAYRDLFWAKSTISLQYLHQLQNRRQGYCFSSFIRKKKKKVFLQGVTIGNMQIILLISRMLSAGIYFIQISLLPCEEGIVV